MSLLTDISINPEVLSKLHFTRANGKLSIWVLNNDRPRIATPEETMRQLVVAALIVEYKYPPERIACEVVIQVGINRPRADIVIFNERQAIEVIIEVKAYNTINALGQISSYMHASGAKYGAVILAKTTNYIELNSHGLIVPISGLPAYGDHDPSKSIMATEDANPIAPLDSLQRLTKSEVLLTYKGESIKLKNNDAASLIKVKRAFLAEGLAFRIGSVEGIKWTERITHVIDTSEIPGKQREDSLADEEKKFLDTLRKIHLPGSPTISLVEMVSSYIRCNENQRKVAIAGQLQLSGIRVDRNMLLFANLIVGDLFANTEHRDSWKLILKSLASSQGTTGTVARFSGRISRCICLPVGLIVS